MVIGIFELVPSKGWTFGKVIRGDLCKPNRLKKVPMGRNNDKMAKIKAFTYNRSVCFLTR